MWYRNAFGAIARADDRAWGAAWRNTLEEAQQEAIKSCRQYSQNPDTCRVIHSKQANGS